MKEAKRVLFALAMMFALMGAVIELHSGNMDQATFWMLGAIFGLIGSREE
jgi:hypothetical protein